MNEPNDPDKRLRQAVFDELHNQKRSGTSRVNTNPAKLLGDFLQVCLRQLGRTPADFAAALDVEQELADGVLEGLLPLSEIDDDFLAEIARAVDYEPNVLRIMIGRKIKPASDADQV